MYGAFILPLLQARAKRLAQIVIRGLMPDESLEIEGEAQLGAMNAISRDGQALAIQPETAEAGAKRRFNAA